jgi:Anti-sigma-K factor rskA, C-terminal
MDHHDVLEQLELAALEPGGLDRLVAGDTPTAAALVAHLAGCESCAEELRRLGRAAPLLREVVRSTPPDDLRERTLAYVKERGRARGEAAGADAPAAVAPAKAGTLAHEPTRAAVPTMGLPERPGATLGRSRARFLSSRVLAWVATIAAAVALAVSAVGFVASRDLADRAATQANAIAALERVQTATLALTADSGSRRVELASTAGTETKGTLLFSPSTADLVVVAYDLARPPAGQEYRCWVEIGGQRHSVGRMFFADELAFWVGDTPEVRDLPDGSVFGVSPTPIGGTSLDAEPVIRGEL